jgi:hypothetical protein
VADELRTLADWLPDSEWPSPSCPKCLSGQLTLAEAITSQEAVESTRWHGHENWEPDMIYGWFYGRMKCNRSQCQEIVVISGEMRLGCDRDENGSWHGSYVEEFRLRYAIPALPLTGALPQGVPDILTERLNEASAVLWTDPSAAANRLRLGVEDLLTKLKVPRFNQKQRRLTTQARLDRLAGSKKNVAQTLEAVKWIGNEGSHESVLTVAEVLDGVDILAHALEELYDTRQAQLQRKVADINARRGLPRKRLSSTK